MTVRYITHGSRSSKTAAWKQHDDRPVLQQPLVGTPPPPRTRRRLWQAAGAALCTILIAVLYYVNRAHDVRHTIRHPNPNFLQPLLNAFVRTELPDLTPAVLHTASDDCAGALQISKVALLFIAERAVVHERVWRAWFAAAEGLIPAEVLHSSSACAQGAFQADLVRHLCGGGGSELSRQHLFSVLVHTPGGTEGLLSGTVFEGTELPNRLMAPPGEQHLVFHGAPFIRVLKLLLAEAFKDPGNAYFALLGDSSVPLYPPAALYRQLRSETKARVNACELEGREEGRWSQLMARPWFREAHWRRSRPWFGLRRSHASVVVSDRRLEQLLANTCPKLRQAMEGVSDKVCRFEEHYVPSLLASKGMDSTTDCHGELMYVEAHPGTNTPHVFEGRDVTEELVRQMRGDEFGCSAREAMQQAAQSMVDVLSAGGLDDVCTAAAPRCALPRGRLCPNHTVTSPNSYTVSIRPHCSLFAHKFASDATPTLLEVLGACKGAARVLCKAA